ncbi:MAG: response regulator [Burkholderiales bacterium]|nr:response regulator [Burkholderiales bacterium]
MQAPAKPANETSRLAALRDLHILDTPPEDRFDRITRIAAELFDLPIAVVSLVDENRQWFKSRQGLVAEQTGRDISFCGHAILQDHVFVIEDTLADPRFSDNPLVKGQPLIRFYAGAPLSGANSTKLGTLCIIDRKPRQFSERDRVMLRGLAMWAERELDIASEYQTVAIRLEHKLRLASVMENLVEGVITADSHGNIESVNTAVTKIFGYAQDELVDSNIIRLIPPAQHAEHGTYMARLRAAPTPLTRHTFETTGVRKDGSALPLDVSFSDLVIGDKRRFIGIVRDITERKKIEQAKKEFVSTVSHELRTPLTSIMGSLELVTSGVIGSLPPALAPLVDIACKNASRLVRLINDILDIDKIESGMMHFDLHSRELMPLITQAIDSNQDYASQHGVKLVLGDGLPGVQVKVDSDRLAQVLANLLSNAAKFSPSGADVMVTVTRNETWARISVSDCGPGIPVEFISRIFQKFSQADSSDTRQKSGTGLGLNITKAIVEHMEGRISFTSNPGAGTTFHVDLPDVTSASIPAAPADATPLPDGARVLICEDDHDIALLLQLMLKEAGYPADISHDAEQAKQMLKQKNYAALTLDIALPGQNGIDLIRELRATDAARELPIIVVSANVEHGQQVLNGGIAIVDWIAKPIDKDRLVLALKQTIGPALTRPRVLHVEDDPDIIKVMQTLLAPHCDVEYALTLSAAKQALQHRPFDLIVLDMILPDGSGSDLLPMVNALTDPPPVLVFSATDPQQKLPDTIAAALVKSQTSNDKLMQTIRRLTRQQDSNTDKSGLIAN